MTLHTVTRFLFLPIIILMMPGPWVLAAEQHPHLAGHSEHLEALDKLIISAPLGQSVANTALPVSVLTGDNLRQKIAATLGETLANEPGITNQSFGPGVGQPVIRGQSGSRVSVMQNGLGSLDVSALSPDHANSTDAFFAQRIEILRGPSSLLYGSSAIGGVVNVIDNRIPVLSYESLLEGAAEQRYNTVNEGKTTAFKVDGNHDFLAFHVDGVLTESLAMQIPDYAVDLTKTGGNYNSQNRLANSQNRKKLGTVGFSVNGDLGYIGFSVNHQTNHYGIPPETADETVRIDATQTRYDMKAELIEPVTGVENVLLRLAYNDYQHVELENNQPGTTYNHEGFLGRIEITQPAWWLFEHGVLGVQTRNSEFSALGVEAIVPKSAIDSIGFFSVQDFHSPVGIYEFGLRVEHQSIDPDNQSATHHTPVSGSLSGLWDIIEPLSLSLSFSHSQRAPDIQELFLMGSHPATQSYDIGNRALTEETSRNIELGLHFATDEFKADLNLYHNWVLDYVARIHSNQYYDLVSETISHQCGSGSCHAVYNVEQHDAQFQGYELQLMMPLFEVGVNHVDAEFFSDYVRGQFYDHGDIPRLPPLRYGFQLTWHHPDLMANIRLTRAERQERPGNHETQTDGYWLLNSGANMTLAEDAQSRLVFYANAKNLLNQTIRQSVSYLRNIAPQQGRGFEFGMRAEF
ncbi:MAG TPA: TonB-dependent receptor [Methylococcaceae bacterium]|nr:TonB-dependent receptor [Methylococcaceae bacterium]